MRILRATNDVGGPLFTLCDPQSAVIFGDVF